MIERYKVIKLQLVFHKVERTLAKMGNKLELDSCQSTVLVYYAQLNLVIKVVWLYFVTLFAYPLFYILQKLIFLHPRKVCHFVCATTIIVCYLQGDMRYSKVSTTLLNLYEASLKISLIKIILYQKLFDIFNKKRLQAVPSPPFTAQFQTNSYILFKQRIYFYKKCFFHYL